MTIIVDENEIEIRTDYVDFQLAVTFVSHRRTRIRNTP